MKKIITLTLLIAICLSTLVLVSCNNGNTDYDVTTNPGETQPVEDGNEEANEILAEGLWANATYRGNRSFGDGEKTIQVEVKADGKSVTFTIKTNAANLADAMIENNLVEGDLSQYGLYVKRVNGILADYDIDASWWGVEINGEMASSGASGINITDGGHYEFVYSK